MTPAERGLSMLGPNGPRSYCQVQMTHPHSKLSFAQPYPARLVCSSSSSSTTKAPDALQTKWLKLNESKQIPTRYTALYHDSLHFDCKHIAAHSLSRCILLKQSQVAPATPFHLDHLPPSRRNQPTFSRSPPNVRPSVANSSSIRPFASRLPCYRNSAGMNKIEKICH